MAGDVGWMDLTVEKAEDVRDFYAEVIGWTAQGLDMGGYDDWWRTWTPASLPQRPAAERCSAVRVVRVEAGTP